MLGALKYLIQFFLLPWADFCSLPFQASDELAFPFSELWKYFSQAFDLYLIFLFANQCLRFLGPAYKLAAVQTVQPSVMRQMRRQRGIQMQMKAVSHWDQSRLAPGCPLAEIFRTVC